MTVSTTTNKVSYAGNGSTTAFAFTFRIFAEADLRVIVRDANGVETVQTLTTHYTISASPWTSGGTVTMVTPPASGETLVIKSDIASTQAVDYLAADRFPAETHEAALDKLTLLIQQTEEALARAPVLQESTAITNFIIPDPETNQTLVWDGSAFGWVTAANLTPGTVNVSTFMETVLDDTTAGQARTTLEITQTNLGISAFAQTLLDDATAAAARATLGADANLSAIRFYTSGATWTKPAGLKRVLAIAIGGGGGGGGGNGSFGGAGGGAGGISMALVEAASLGATETVTIGAAGTSGAAGATGGNGGNTSFGAHAVGNGGSGGSANGGSGGAGGASSGGNLNGTGAPGITHTGAGTSVRGTSGGSSWFGGGGRPGASGSANGDAGGGYGAGGGGAATNGAGGAGSAGVCMVWEFL